ncbi:MAG: HD-GYP domain-containing protein, partial [Armatimonadetes bacterium]|nr:HD-GYP domain-containing protein [Armatimonadota bacterium]
CLPFTVVNPKDVLLDTNQPAERIVGVLQFLQKQGERFSPEDMDIFNAFSNLVAVAVHNRRLNEGLQEAFSTVKTLAEAIESKDHYTYGHSKRVTEFALAIFDEIAGVPEDRKALEIAALLHDVGKVGIRPDLLQKEGELTDEEYEHVRSHPEISYHILKKTRHFRKILPAIRHHHERFDGRGFPDGLRGDDINLAAKIISVADAFDAMTSDRPYRQAMSQEDAAAELRRGSGTQFDPRIVEAFLLAREKGKIQPTIGKWSEDANNASRHTGGI